MRRGLDHGVWASFKVVFNPETNPLNVPIVQVSLFATEDPVQHIALGKAVSKLREEGIQIIVSGMAVHNLRDMRFGMDGVRPYTKSFDEALRVAVEAPAEGGERDRKLVELLKRSDARPAHPSFEVCFALLLRCQREDLLTMSSIFCQYTSVLALRVMIKESDYGP